MKKIISAIAALACFVILPLVAQKPVIYIFPDSPIRGTPRYWPTSLDGLDFDVDGNKWNYQYWGSLERALESIGYGFESNFLTEFRGFSLQEITRGFAPGGRWDHIKKILFIGYPFSGEINDIIRAIPKERKVLLLFDSPVVIPNWFSRQFHEEFGSVITWADYLVDNKKYFKYYTPSLEQIKAPILDFNQKKLVCMILGFKRPLGNQKDEIYSMRKRIIKFFEKSGRKDFDLYGPGWGRFGFSCYKGLATSKIITARNYKFCFCLENAQNHPGYITERIFDCFAAGTVPIYQGAPNIELEIPSNCYIQMKKFKTLKELYHHISRLSESEYNEYIENIQKFLASDAAQKFSSESYARQMIQNLQLLPQCP